MSTIIQILSWWRNTLHGKQKLVLIVIVGTLVLTVIFIKKQQQYQGKANINLDQAVSVSAEKDGVSQPVECHDGVCTTDAEKVHVQFNQQNAQDLLNSLP